MLYQDIRNCKQFTYFCKQVEIQKIEPVNCPGVFAERIGILNFLKKINIDHF